MTSTRRTLLSVLSAVGLGSLAGCSGDTSGDTPSSDTPEETPTPELAADPSLVKKLTPSDGVAGARFGRAVSASGTTVAIASVRSQDSDDKDTGLVHVYTKEDGSWILQTQLSTEPRDYAEAESVAIDDDTIVLGGSPATVFERSEGSWNHQTTLSPGGSEVDLDGDTAVLNDGESAVVFSGSDGSWSQEATLEFSSQRGAGSIALDDGTVFLESNSSVYVFDRDDGEWTQTIKLTGQGLDAYDLFGTGIEVHGNTAAIGVGEGEAKAPNEVRILNHSEGSWTRKTTVTDNESSGTNFGKAVSLTDSTMLVGANNDMTKGAAYVFKRSDGEWQRESKHVPDDARDNDLFGAAVGLGAGFGVVGAPHHNTATGEDAGAAYVFE